MADVGQDQHSTTLQVAGMLQHDLQHAFQHAHCVKWVGCNLPLLTTVRGCRIDGQEGREVVKNSSVKSRSWFTHDGQCVQ